MIRVCNKKDYDLINSYIGDNYHKCLYLYLDFKKYGFSNKNVKVYVQKNNNEVSCLILTYYTGMHIYSTNYNINYDELSNFVADKHPSMVCGEKVIIEKLEAKLKKYDYQSIYGWIRLKDEVDQTNEKIQIEPANEDDFVEITKLLMTDVGLGGSYEFDELYDQLLTRFKEKYCRNYVLRKEGKIVGHVCSGAEDENIVVLTEFIIDDKYRGMGLGQKVCQDFCRIMTNEGKKVFLVNYTEVSSRVYQKVGFKICCDWGKLFINK